MSRILDSDSEDNGPTISELSSHPSSMPVSSMVHTMSNEELRSQQALRAVPPTLGFIGGAVAGGGHVSHHGAPRPPPVVHATHTLQHHQPPLTLLSGGAPGSQQQQNSTGGSGAPSLLLSRASGAAATSSASRVVAGGDDDSSDDVPLTNFVPTTLIAPKKEPQHMPYQIQGQFMHHSVSTASTADGRMMLMPMQSSLQHPNMIVNVVGGQYAPLMNMPPIGSTAHMLSSAANPMMLPQHRAAAATASASNATTSSSMKNHHHHSHSTSSTTKVSSVNNNDDDDDDVPLSHKLKQQHQEKAVPQKRKSSSKESKVTAGDFRAHNCSIMNLPLHCRKRYSLLF